MNAATERGGETAGKPNTAGWRVADPEAGDPVFVCPGCWPAVAAYWEERSDATVRVVGPRPEWARLRDLRSGAGVLMRAIEEGPAGAVRNGTAPRNGGACRDGAANAR